ncbi:MAG: response regulator receiver protein [Segetibacter sp.]|jgi:CheY-like chemotaxis protein|nr:response regulator receiver protein [Segetibacter sp.]
MKKHLTVLIIDDDADDKEMFCEVVAEIGANISCVMASGAQEALHLLKNKKVAPDFIFLDLNMPRMNGKQCLEQLKQVEEFASIPVIIYSTSKNNEDKEITRKLGSVYFLTKPSSMQDLKKELESIFAKEYENVVSKNP